MDKIDAYFRAANYLSACQIYLKDNPLLRRPLSIKDIKPRLLGHFGTTPGINFVYVHMNQMIIKYDLNVLFLLGPGHGGPALIANTYLEGSYSEVYPSIEQNEEGLKKLFKQFSFPMGVPSHASPETVGSIHEGGELGYVLAHAYGAVMDNKDLIALAIVGDGEAETGPLATSWHSNKFINPEIDGAVLPVLHLNGYKIANPTLLSRIENEDLLSLFKGYGYEPIIVHDSHEEMANALDQAILKIKKIQDEARSFGYKQLAKWPMIILKTPKGWTGPKFVDGKMVENSFRSHQVPISDLSKNEHLMQLEEWLKSYKPEELFDKSGALIPELHDIIPKGSKRMGLNPSANGGNLLKDLVLPNYKNYAIHFEKKGQMLFESTKVIGDFLRDLITLNDKHQNFRLFGPDETASNRLNAVFEVTNRVFEGEILPTDEWIAKKGRVLEVLSEHLCEGWLEGYLLTGRHGLFSCYEAFIHIIDSMFNQHAKWLQSSSRVAWRKPIASLNYLLTSHVWRQDHNGFSHQDPGFIDLVVNKKASTIRVYLPPDANCLLCVINQCLSSKNLINVVISGKQPALQYLTMDEAIKHTNKGIGIFEFASNDLKSTPDIVLACSGDIPTLETLAATELLRKYAPDIKVRVVNVVDLMVLTAPYNHPHGLSDIEYEALFTKDKPIIFAFHGYPWLIHRLTYNRPNHDNLHVHGYIEEGTTTTPFDMTVLNKLDRYHLFENAIKRLEKLEDRRAYLFDFIKDKLSEHREYIAEHGQDLPEIRNWKWTLS